MNKQTYFPIFKPWLIDENIKIISPIKPLEINTWQDYEKLWNMKRNLQIIERLRLEMAWLPPLVLWLTKI